MIAIIDYDAGNLASVQRAVNEAKKACDTGPTLAKRIVFLSDQQASNWRDLARPDQFAELSSYQVVDVSADNWENTWISAYGATMAPRNVTSVPILSVPVPLV